MVGLERGRDEPPHPLVAAEPVREQHRAARPGPRTRRRDDARRRACQRQYPPFAEGCAASAAPPGPGDARAERREPDGGRPRAADAARGVRDGAAGAALRGAQVGDPDARAGALRVPGPAGVQAQERHDVGGGAERVGDRRARRRGRRRATPSCSASSTSPASGRCESTRARLVERAAVGAARGPDDDGWIEGGVLGHAGLLGTEGEGPGSQCATAGPSAQMNVLGVWYKSS